MSGPAFGKALASASLDVASFIWFVDLGAPGPSAEDEILLARISGNDPAYGDLDSARDDAGLEVSIAPPAGTGDDWDGDRREDELTTPIDPPRLCVGADCDQAPPENDFSPLPVEFSGTYSNADLALSGYMMDVTPGGPTGGESLGLRADISLPVPDPSAVYAGEAEATLRQDADIEFDPSAAGDIFSTYFAVIFEAQALARLSDGEQEDSEAVADLEFEVNVEGEDGTDFSWDVTNLNAEVTPDDQELLDKETAPPTPGPVYSFTSEGMLVLTRGVEYELDIDIRAFVTATANEPPVGVPAPSAFMLVLSGLVFAPLFRLRARRGDAARRCRPESPLRGSGPRLR